MGKIIVLPAFGHRNYFESYRYRSIHRKGFLAFYRVRTFRRSAFTGNRITFSGQAYGYLTALDHYVETYRTTADLYVIAQLCTAADLHLHLITIAFLYDD